MRNRLFLMLFCVLLIGSCKEPFTPFINTTTNNLLVVEGFINSASDSTIIKLSRTVVIEEKNTTTNPESGAIVTVEGENNEIYNLPELNLNKGTYAYHGLNLNSSKKYRLKIKTSIGSTYVSDFVNVKISPPIDDIGYAIKNDGLQIHVSTHDDTNQSIYYRWEYEESWIFNAKYNSLLIYKEKLVERQPTTENIFQCWSSAKSSTVVLGSSNKLNKDVISQSPITLIPTESEKIGIKYSLLVKQYVLTKDAYEFWENLRKNTESLGSIFDAQPSQLIGNIHNVNDVSERVIGYIGAGTFQTKRIFITKAELPAIWKVKYPFDCIPDVIPRNREIDAFSNGKFIPIEYVSDGILGISRDCGDCTIRGSSKKPGFWL